MPHSQLKFKYVVFASLDIYASDFMHIMYNDLQGKDNITFIDTPFENCRHKRFLQFLHKYHFHGYLNKFFELPFKSLWNRFYYNEKSESPQNLCFVFFMSSLITSSELFFQYLRKEYPGCKMVVYFEDIVASRERNGGNTLRLDFISKYFDLALTYDKGDSEKYGFLFYPTSYSVVDIHDNAAIERSDLFFCGAAKRRYNLITDIYKTCREESLSCDFIIARYGGDQKVKGINYVPYTMSYKDYLEHMAKTNCLLDVIQSGSKGFTVRVWEALVYGKKMLTNNKEILEASFYDEHQFCYFEQIGDKELDFIKRGDKIAPRYQERLSPMRLLELIEKVLEDRL